MFPDFYRLLNNRCLNRVHQSLRGKSMLAKSLFTHRVSLLYPFNPAPMLSLTQFLGGQKRKIG